MMLVEIGTLLCCLCSRHDTYPWWNVNYSSTSYLAEVVRSRFHLQTLHFCCTCYIRSRYICIIPVVFTTAVCPYMVINIHMLRNTYHACEDTVRCLFILCPKCEVYQVFISYARSAQQSTKHIFPKRYPVYTTAVVYHRTFTFLPQRLNQHNS